MSCRRGRERVRRGWERVDPRLSPTRMGEPAGARSPGRRGTWGIAGDERGSLGLEGLRAESPAWGQEHDRHFHSV